MEPKLITLGKLLLTYSPAVLARAIDKHGLYGWDEFGVWGEFKNKSETALLARRKLSEVYYAIVEASRHEPQKSWHGVLTGKNLIGPLHHLGWLLGQMPDFEKINQEISGGPKFMKLDIPPMRDSTAISIIGALLETVIEQPFHQSDIAEIKQTNVIEHLTTRYQGFPGISVSNLEKFFSAGNNFISTFGTSVSNNVKSKSKPKPKQKPKTAKKP